MDISEIWEQAKKDAAKTAPPPVFNPWEAALGAVFVTMIALITFCGILDLDTDHTKVRQGMAITSTLVGLAVFFPLRHQEKKNLAAWSRRVDELMEAARRQTS